MELDFTRVRRCLREFDFKTLFIEELGWDRQNTLLDVSVDGQTFQLTAIAEKRGMVALTCAAPGDGRIPDYSTRRKIERQTAKSVHEHLIIYTDSEKTTQIWQWVKREAGKPTACREHTYHRNQPGDALIQKIQAIAFSLEEEDRLTIVDVTRRARAAFDVERVTRRFYDRFKAELASFLKFLKGIPDEEMQSWYASVMLNRLMFIYFIQKKGFVDNDPNYLRSKLAQSKKLGKDLFYHAFLCPLFFEGFAKKESERSSATNQLLGKVPYLNGGLFLRHQIEELHGKHIQIADTAFEKIFEFFDQYQWHLDERPLRADNEINPDVLGYIFEKYINQKQMGAYYTKEDITEYISKNTVIPFLFDAARQKCKTAFEGEQSIWGLLKADPDRYIYEAVRRGVIDENNNIIPENILPDFVQKGMHDPKARMFDKRYNLGEAYVPDSKENNLSLPTETWREYAARRKRCLELRQKLALGEVRDINDLITYNLNIRQFAQDVIENCEAPELLRAFYHAIEKVTILDPTCGSGAFLFAALNILEPLYQACLDRTEAFVSDLERSGEKHRPEKFSDFHKVLERVAKHPNPRYFILKSIIINNLFGVDIIEEGVEICKLRLFLKLVAQVERIEYIEPLPDIDFNIRAGNTLVGFANYDEVKRAIRSKLDFDNTMARIEEKAQDIERLFRLFRQQQTELGGEITPEDKQELQNRLKVLEEELNRYLAAEYGVDLKDKPSYDKWLSSRKPFQWFIEFYGIIKSGGFDVIIGNPPYVEYRKVRDEYTIKGYETESCGNLYAFVIERCFDILLVGGFMGMIVQLPIVCTDRMKPLQKKCLEQSKAIWFGNFDDRPARLFDGLEHIRASIFTIKKGEEKDGGVYSTTYNRWYSEARPMLFELLSFAEISNYLTDGAIPKIGQSTAKLVRQRIAHFSLLGKYLTANAAQLAYFHNSPQYWIRAMNFAPYFWNERDGEQISTQVKSLHLETPIDVSVVVATLNSSLFYWWFIVLSDCRHLNLREIENFPIGLDSMSKVTKKNLAGLSNKLMDDLKSHANRKETYYRTTGKVIYDEFYPKYSKPIIDEIDCVLAQHYGITDEELDLIINYDIKYRLGRDAEEAE
jgi:hypothetical protein